jgi:Zn-finger protein
LYFLENCGGDHELRQGVKDCTPCLRPHCPQGYDAILTRLREEATLRRKAVGKTPGTPPSDPAGGE